MKILAIRTDIRAVRLMIKKIYITSTGFYVSIEYIDKKIKQYLEALDIWINFIVHGNDQRTYKSITNED